MVYFQIFSHVEPDLVKFGERVATEMYDLHYQCEMEKPYLEKYNGWGKTVDKLVTGPAWRKMHDIAAEEGLVSIAYEREYGEWRLVAFLCVQITVYSFDLIRYVPSTIFQLNGRVFLGGTSTKLG